MDIHNLFDKLNIPEYAAIDLETTGLSLDDDRITEIGIVIVKYGQIVDKLQWVVNPEKEIPYNIVKLTGITNEMVADKPKFAEIADDVLKVIKDIPLVGQNVIFDVNFLEAAFRRVHKNFSAWQKRYKEYYYVKNVYYDTAYLSRLIFPFFPRFNLSALAENFGYVPDIAHRALADAETAARVFNILMEKLSLLSREELENLIFLFSTNKSPLKNLLELVHKEKIISAFTQGETDWNHANLEHANIVGKIDYSFTEDDEEVPFTEIDEEKIVEIFSSNGVLADKLEGFESRNEQIEMAGKIASTFNKGQILAVEAGTGTGKSLAYLVPAIYMAVKNKKRKARIVISTNTKNLQEQLFYKDIPFLKAVLQEDFSAVLLKGKSNYLCLDRWYHILKNPSERLAEHDKVQAGLLTHWKSLTSTGDISEHHGFPLSKNISLWSKFIAEDNYCPVKKCAFYNQCYLWKIRNAARFADIVVVNHALLCSDLAADNSILGPYDYLIVDEAHNLEKTAIDYLGYSATFWDIKDVLDNLFNKDKNLGVLIQMENALLLEEGIDKQEKTALLAGIAELKANTGDILTESRKLFTKINNFITNVLAADKNSSYVEGSVSGRMKNGGEIQEQLLKLYSAYREKISKYIVNLINFNESFRMLSTERMTKREQLMQDLTAKMSRLENFREQFDFIVSCEDLNFVYWFENSPKFKEYDIRFYASPLKIDKMLHELLFSKLESAVLTSATITVDNSFDYFFGKLGLTYLENGKLAGLQLHSPFDYKKQITISVPEEVPQPNTKDFTDYVQQMLSGNLTELGKGTLVLFTSYYMLKKIYFNIKSIFNSSGTLLLGQGIDGSRNNLIQQFKDEETSVLFGTNSFWEGVDVPGKSLEILIITKLPFEVPSDPIIEARFEMLEAEGKNPFMEYMLPEAIIKLKQGIGRLIRSGTDRGAVIITDPRIITKAYSRIIRNSLPVSIKKFANDKIMFNFIKNWFEKEI